MPSPFPRSAPVLRTFLTQVTEEYIVEMVLLDYGVMVFPLQISWDPKEPTALEMLGVVGDEMVEVMDMFFKLAGDAR